MLNNKNSLAREDLGSFLFFTIPRDKTKSKICRKTCLLRNNGCEDWVILQKNTKHVYKYILYYSWNY